MSLYSHISKTIGWDPCKVAIPSVDEAERLKRLVINEHCSLSFTTVFRIHRFAGVSKTNEEFKAMNIIYQAFEKGTEIFKGYHA